MRCSQKAFVLKTKAPQVVDLRRHVELEGIEPSTRYQIDRGPSRSAPARSAPARFAPFRSAPVRFAQETSAPVRSAPVRFAPGSIL